MTGKDIAMMTFVRPFQLMFLEPIVFALNLVSRQSPHSLE